MNKQIKADECNLGDTISTGMVGPWSTSVVIRKTATHLVLFRPYAITADFEYTDGVIPYIGFEEYSVPRSFSVILHERSKPKK